MGQAAGDDFQGFAPGGHQGPRPGDVQEPLQAGFGIGAVQHREHRAQPQRRQDRPDHLRSALGQDRHAVAGLHAPSRQGPRQAARTRLQVRVAVASPFVQERGRARRPGGLGQDAGVDQVPARRRRDRLRRRDRSSRRDGPDRGVDIGGEGFQQAGQVLAKSLRTVAAEDALAPEQQQVDPVIVRVADEPQIEVVLVVPVAHVGARHLQAWEPARSAPAGTSSCRTPG